MQRSIVLLALALVACGDDDATSTRPFALRFAAVNDGLTTLGPDADVTATITDLRFYVSNVVGVDADGGEHAVTLDTNEFQYGDRLTLIDLTSDTSGEGTARTNDVVSGRIAGEIRHFSFDVGVPQDVMREVIANDTAEGAPSPMNEMYWSWASGYRHFVMNLGLSTATEQGEGFIHLGSRDCGSGGQKALSDRDQCTFVNTPHVEIDVDDASTTVSVELARIFSGLSLRDSDGVLAASCHSGPQGDCVPVFSTFGLDIETGTADAATNVVFAR